MRIAVLTVLLILIGLPVGGLLGVSGSSTGLVLTVVIMIATACLLIWGYWQQHARILASPESIQSLPHPLLAMLMLASLALSLTGGNALGWYVRQDTNPSSIRAKSSPNTGNLESLILLWEGDGLSEADIRRRLFDRAYPLTGGSSIPSTQRSTQPVVADSSRNLTVQPSQPLPAPSTAFPGRYAINAPAPSADVCIILQALSGDSLRTNIETLVATNDLDTSYRDAADAFNDAYLREEINRLCAS